MLVDLIIVLFIVFSIIRNWQSGFMLQFWPIVGFILGFFLGRYLDTFTIKLAHTTVSRSLVTVITIFAVALIGLSIGEFIGFKLKHKWLGSRFDVVDNYLCSLVSAASILLSAWLIAAVLVRIPGSSLKTDIQQSHIISALDRLLPPAPTLLSDIGKLINPNGFPDVFIGSEPIPRGNVNLPSLGSLASAVNADEQSVVRIQGLGCGGIVSGSGFVVSNDLVATNAHVVAGISHPVIEDANGRHNTEIIWFDPNLDLAVLKTSNLAGAPLKLDTNEAAPGTPGAVLGYPGGGAFSAGPAAILDTINASGRDIYGQNQTLRRVYELQANVIPGNSGGPLVEVSGDVMGVVFAESTTYNHVGYALTMSKVASEINQAKQSQNQVSSGQCAD